MDEISIQMVVADDAPGKTDSPGATGDSLPPNPDLGLLRQGLELLSGDLLHAHCLLMD
jgi:hypothetical protein